jgi:hypothetical protein
MSALFETEFRNDSAAGFSMILREDRCLESAFFGNGHLDITHAFVDALEKALAVAGPAPVPGIVDLKELQKSPLRAQFVLGKWLLKNKARFTKLALCGAKPWEAKLAKMIMKIAGMKDFSFFDDLATGQRWLQS